ncbi:MAG: gliding motility associated protein GldN [Maribacter sp.]|jgi:gliding motility associated protien GldN
MKFKLKISVLSLFLFLFAGMTVTNAQTPTPPGTDVTESGESTDDDEKYIPLDGIVEKTLITERRVLPYQPQREADIFWEKRVWRVIDVREKMNKRFVYPRRYFFDIIMDGIMDDKIKAYSINDMDDFSEELSKDEAAALVSEVDTFVSFDPETYEETIEVAYNDLNPEDIKRYRIKELWFFDEETSTLQVRILGIAPLKEEYDDQGNFLYELPMFWIYYPDVREMFSREQAFNENNDAGPMNWHDIFEMRYFSSYIYKESNVYDRKVEHYLQGVDLLLESEKIRMGIFNFEHDLWEY